MLGLKGAGKSAILNKLRYDDPSFETIPTIGFNAESIVYNNFKCSLWDVSGSDSSRLSWQHLYFHGTKGLIFVIDSSDRARMDVVRQELLKCDREMKRKVPFLVFANKQDLKQEKMDMVDVTRELHLHQYHKKRKIKVLLASARTGQGFAEGFRWLKKRI